MHGHSHTHNEHAPINHGKSPREKGVKNIYKYGSLALAGIFSASCTAPQQYHAPTAQRAVGISPVTLSFAINQAQQKGNPQMAIEALVNYARYCSTPLTPQWLNYARYELARARAHGGQLSPEQKKLMIQWLYSEEKKALPPGSSEDDALPPIDHRLTNDGTVQVDAPSDDETLPA